MVFHKFSQIAGRIVPSTTNPTYVPQGVVGVGVEAPEFRFESAAVHKAPVAPATTAEAVGGRAAAGAPKGVIPTSSGYQNIVKLQKAFALDDGLMVWQKRGMRDKLPLWLTFATMGVGLCLCFSTLYKMSYPAKQQD